MKKRFLIAFMLLGLLICSRQRCFAQATSSSELIKNARFYDGQLVVYEGEVIGDLMRRADGVWVNLNDGPGAIGVWMSSFLARKINYAGNYKTRGDRLEVAGIFHRACLEHGGDLDIHAQGINVIAAGREVSEKLNLDKRNLAVILLGIIILLWISTLLRRK